MWLSRSNCRSPRTPECGAPGGTESYHSSVTYPSRSGGEKGLSFRLVINGAARAFLQTDQLLLRAVARAHRWFDDLVGGQIDGRDRQVQRSRHNTLAGSYVWRFSHPRRWSGLWQAVNRLSLPRKHYGPAVLIFQWAGPRKSGPSDFRRRPEPPPINSGPAASFFCSK